MNYWLDNNRIDRGKAEWLAGRMKQHSSCSCEFRNYYLQTGEKARLAQTPVYGNLLSIELSSLDGIKRSQTFVTKDISDEDLVQALTYLEEQFN